MAQPGTSPDFNWAGLFPTASAHTSSQENPKEPSDQNDKVLIAMVAFACLLLEALSEVAAKFIRENRQGM